MFAKPCFLIFCLSLLMVFFSDVSRSMSTTRSSRKRAGPGTQPAPKRVKAPPTQHSGRLFSLDGTSTVVLHGRPVHIGQVTLSANILADGSLRLTTLPQTSVDDPIESRMANLNHVLHQRKTDVEAIMNDLDELTQVIQESEDADADICQQVGNNHAMIGRHKK
jgi:hypothetical protein